MGFIGSRFLDDSLSEEESEIAVPALSFRIPLADKERIAFYLLRPPFPFNSGRLVSPTTILFFFELTILQPN